VPTPEQRAAIGLLGHDLDRVWSATTTTDRDRKELLHALLEEVIITLDRAGDVLRGVADAHLTLRWRAGLFSELRRLAEHYPDAVIAGILNRQGRKTATGQTQVWDRALSGRGFFEEVIRENIDLGRPEQVQLIFARKLRRKTVAAGRCRTRIIQQGVQPSLHVYTRTRTSNSTTRRGAPCAPKQPSTILTTSRLAVC
jgi:hypothetical protein